MGGVGNFERRPSVKRRVIVDTEAKLAAMVRRLMKTDAFAFDTETTTTKVLGDNSDLIVVGVSFSWGDSRNYYVPLGHRRHEDYGRQLDRGLVAGALRKVFARANVTLVGHNIAFDLHVLKRMGIDVATNDLFDTMVASWLCDENEPKGLKEVSMRLLDIKAETFANVVDTVPGYVKQEFGLRSTARATFDLALIDDAAGYAAADAFNAWKLYVGFVCELEDEGMADIFYGHYMPLVGVCFRMEERGVAVDLGALHAMSAGIKEDLEALKYEMFEIVGAEFNPGSDQQLREILYGHVKRDKAGRDGGIRKSNVNGYLLDRSFDFEPVSFTPSGEPSTNNAALHALSKIEPRRERDRTGLRLVKCLIKFSALEKLDTAFISGLTGGGKIYEDGRVRPTINIVGTDSGRFSYSSPNLQQLPRPSENPGLEKYRIRSMFIGSEYGAPDGAAKRKAIVAADYSNLEMRLLAHFSKDENLLEMFAAGDDTHGSTAVNMFGLGCKAKDAKKLHPELRQAAKTINFLLMYGGGAQSLYRTLKEDKSMPIDLGGKEHLRRHGARSGIEVAQAYIDKYFASYSGVADFIKRQKRAAHKDGHARTLLGRKRRLKRINGNDKAIKAYEERVAVNAAIQGSAGDIIMSAQLRIDADGRLKEIGCDMLIQVHDELVFECPEEHLEEACAIIKRLMENPFAEKSDIALNLPLVAEHGAGRSYHDAK